MNGPAKPRNANLWQTAKAVLSAFIGIRRGNAPGSLQLSPARVIVVAIICAAVFVLTLITIVKSVVG
jgi:hypothetical protein